jgi:hypothetical protein
MQKNLTPDDGEENFVVLGRTNIVFNDTLLAAPLRY